MVKIDNIIEEFNEKQIPMKKYLEDVKNNLKGVTNKVYG